MFALCFIFSSSCVYAVVLPAECTFDLSPEYVADFHNPTDDGLFAWWGFDYNDATFRPENGGSTFEGYLFVTLKKELYNGYEYTGGSYQTYKDDFGYGKYEVIMKPAEGCGTVSASFPFDDYAFASGGKVEFDIEFICNPESGVREIQFNYWTQQTDGASGNEFRIIETDIYPNGLRACLKSFQ